MSIFNRITSMFQRQGFDNVRTEKIKPFQAELEIKTDTIWFEDHNTEDCIRAAYKLGIEHIHLQTSNINFLNDPRLQNIKGVTMQFEVSDITPLFSLKNLTHLHFPENVKKEVDFTDLKQLVFLGGTLPKEYINLNKLSNLKFVKLFDYSRPDLKEFANCKKLKTLWLYSPMIINLEGLSDLKNLAQIDLENCRKLTSLNGLQNTNIKLEALHIVNCKKLLNASALSELPALERLQLYQIPELESLSFLNSLHRLQSLALHPGNVGVQHNNYYPLIDTLRKLNKLDNLKGWRPLNDYLQRKVIITSEKTNESHRSELELIKENIGILNWVEKSKNGLKQFSVKNCKKATSIILELIKSLENSSDSTLSEKQNMIRNCVLALNEFNDGLGGCFIETQEREELCDLFDNIADAMGINVQNHPDGLIDGWRKW